MSFKSGTLINLIIKLKRVFNRALQKMLWLATYSRDMHRMKINPRKKYMKGCLGLSLLLFIALLRYFSWLPLPSKTSLTRTRPGKFSRSPKCSVESKQDAKCYLFNIVIAFQIDREIISSYARHICCSCFIPCR